MEMGERTPKEKKNFVYTVYKHDVCLYSIEKISRDIRTIRIPKTVTNV